MIYSAVWFYGIWYPLRRSMLLKSEGEAWGQEGRDKMEVMVTWETENGKTDGGDADGWGYCGHSTEWDLKGTMSHCVSIWVFLLFVLEMIRKRFGWECDLETWHDSSVVLTAARSHRQKQSDTCSKQWLELHVQCAECAKSSAVKKKWCSPPLLNAPRDVILLAPEAQLSFQCE